MTANGTLVAYDTGMVTPVNVIYDSENYYLVEYPAQHGYELVDKHTRYGAFFQGNAAERFAQSMRDVMAEDNVSIERFDEFLGDFDLKPMLCH